MNNVGIASAKDARDPRNGSIGTETNELHGQLVGFAEEVRALENRLMPVLLGYVPAPPGGKAISNNVPTSQKCEAGMQLASANSILDELRGRIRMILSNLDI